MVRPSRHALLTEGAASQWLAPCCTSTPPSCAHQLVDRLHDALQAQRDETSAPAPPTPRAAAPYRVAAGQGGAPPKPQREKHLVVQFEGAAEWCHASPSSTVDSSETADSADEASGETSGDTCGDFGADGFGQPGAALASSDAEDAMLMAEAWLNLHFDRPT